MKYRVLKARTLYQPGRGGNSFILLSDSGGNFSNFWKFPFSVHGKQIGQSSRLPAGGDDDGQRPVLETEIKSKIKAAAAAAMGRRWPVACKALEIHLLFRMEN